MAKPSSPWWWNISTREFATLDWARLVAVQPIGAVEQHGPHLPVRVDAAINAGIVERAVALLPAEISVLILPPLPAGKSTEHAAFPGTLSLNYETLARVWIEIGESVHRAGGRRILYFNSHGGQPQVAEIVCRELRAKLAMLAVSCAWWQLADFSDLFSESERTHGIHGGEIETSLMLHLHPELVDMPRAENFVSRSVAMEAAGALLTPEAGIGFAWQTQDLHPMGACGNAAAADAQRGRELVERSARGLVKLVSEMAELSLDTLKDKTAYS
jgi:creatinine amidohydrolase